MIQFYAPGLPEDTFLPETEANHCLRVLRMGVDDEIMCVDGRGNRYTCRIADTSHKKCRLEIVDSIPVQRQWNSEIVLAVAPTKHIDRMEWLVEKLVEIGIDRIIPLLCERSERRELKVERLEKIAVSAMKQSLKAAMPVIDPMTKLSDVVAEFGRCSDIDRYIAYCDPSIPRRLLACDFNPGRPMLIMIGPEGDFSQAEITASLQGGFMPVSLGAMRLRTETAALYAVAMAHAISDRNSCCIK